MDITTRYLGMTLRSPLVASAVVLYSLFQRVQYMKAVSSLPDDKSS